jgi:hypothetical protein
LCALCCQFLISFATYHIIDTNFFFIHFIQRVECTLFTSTFRRKKVELLSSLLRLGQLSFLSESISQKLSKVSI